MGRKLTEKLSINMGISFGIIYLQDRTEIILDHLDSELRCGVVS